MIQIQEETSQVEEKRCFDKKRLLVIGMGESLSLLLQELNTRPDVTIVCTLMPSSGLKKDILPLNLPTEEAQPWGKKRLHPSLTLVQNLSNQVFFFPSFTR